MTISNFINKYLTDNIENIFKDIMNKIVETNNIDLDYAYIDGTKITSLLNSINDYVLSYALF